MKLKTIRWAALSTGVMFAFLGGLGGCGPLGLGIAGLVGLAVLGGGILGGN